jgi:hypothetical protein
MVRGGAFFPNFAPARVAGSSLGGGFLKLHGVYAGFQMELVTDDLPIITTRVRTVSVLPTRDVAVCKAPRSGAGLTSTFPMRQRP